MLAIICPATEALCKLQEPSQTQSVRYIHDGDTLELKDGKRIRMIGINTPEIGYRDEPPQPLAIKARDLLRTQLRSGRIFIVYDQDRYDKYGRVLAHVFDDQQNNVAAWLIQKGLGFAVSVPPNLRYRKCYHSAEQEAVMANRGVWVEPYFKIVEAEALKQSGFRRVHGCIQRIHSYRDKKYFYLSKQYRLLLLAENQHYFESRSIVLKKGLCLTTAGWVYNDRSYRTMKLLHPDAIESIH